MAALTALWAVVYIRTIRVETSPLIRTDGRWCHVGALPAPPLDTSGQLELGAHNAYPPPPPSARSGSGATPVAATDDVWARWSRRSRCPPQRYRLMANVVGAVLLISAHCVAVPLKYFFGGPPASRRRPRHRPRAALTLPPAVRTWRCGPSGRTPKGSALTILASTVPFLSSATSARHAEDTRRRARLTPAVDRLSTTPEDLRLMRGMLATSPPMPTESTTTPSLPCARRSTACGTAAPTRTRPGGRCAVFGFNRLSFIDIEHSHQPMPYADGRYRIVFNGEIYNYLELWAELAEAGAMFATRGDTEAIVAGLRDVLQRQVVLQGGRFHAAGGLAPAEEFVQGLLLGTEDQPAVGEPGGEQRLDAERVAGAEHRVGLAVPDDEGEHAAQLRDDVRAPQVEPGDDRLGVTLGGERRAGLGELGPQLEEL